VSRHANTGYDLRCQAICLIWLPTFVDIAGGPKGDGLKKEIEAGNAEMDLTKESAEPNRNQANHWKTAKTQVAIIFGAALPWAKRGAKRKRASRLSMADPQQSLPAHASVNFRRPHFES
jgi:hypothetical protein